jgi:A/G-specific adenine glycosylase
MDLGATVCRPKAPLCGRCPVADFCDARAGGAPETYPRKAAKADRPRRYGAVYVLRDGGRTALVRRPDKGLLGGMLGLPTSDWRPEPWSETEALAAAPASALWRWAGEIEHVFTHFALRLKVYAAQGADGDFIWTDAQGLSALPSVFLKAARAAQERLC